MMRRTRLSLAPAAGGDISSYLGSLWTTTANAATSTAASTYSWLGKSFEGLTLSSLAEIERNKPPLWRPVKRWQYRQYVIKHYRPASSEGKTLSGTLKSVGLEPQAIIGVLAVYIGTFCALWYYMIAVVWYALYFALGYAAPSDPRLQNNSSSSSSSASSSATKNIFFDDDYCAVSPQTAAAIIRRDADNNIIVVHGPVGSGKSTLVRRATADVPGVKIYVKITPSITSSDPLEVIGQRYGGMSGRQVSYVFWILTKILRQKNPLLVFDVDAAPGAMQLVSSSRYNRTSSSSLPSSSLVSSDSSSGPTATASSSSSSTSQEVEVIASSSSSVANNGRGFQLERFLEHCKDLACDHTSSSSDGGHGGGGGGGGGAGGGTGDSMFSDGCRVLVEMDTALLYTEAAPFVRNDFVSEIEVGELSQVQANKLLSNMTNVFAPSMTPYSKRTVRFLKERLGRHLLSEQEKVQQQQQESVDGGIPSELAAVGSGMAAAKNLLRTEYRQMETSAASIFHNCIDELKLRALASENNELLWPEIEQYCSNKYGSNEQFRLVAEVREGLFTSTGPSTYRPRYEVIRDKVLPGKKFMSK